MILILLFAITTVYLPCVAGVPDDVACCKTQQSILAEDNNKCVDIVSNRTSDTILSCETIIQIPMSENNYIITDEGLLILPQENMEMQLDKYTYCVENGRLTINNETIIAMCSESEEEIIDEAVLGYCMIVSVVFLFLTAGVYLFLPELWDIQGKSIISFCVSLALGLAILSIMKLMEYSDMRMCATRGFLVYFFLISAFFWMNAISIQILLNIRRPTTADYGWKPFIWYALYAWGLPVVFTSGMAIVNFHPGLHRKPGIGLNTCWFYGKRHQWEYMYSVMTALILANICIFIYISLYLCRHSYASTHVKALKYKFTMTIRLFIIMGLPWIFEMLSSLFKPHIIWVITDIFNCVQGFIIFLILVVFRRKVIKSMYKRGWMDCMSGVVERHLAIGDDEEEVVQHTTDVGLDDRRIN